MYGLLVQQGVKVQMVFLVPVDHLKAELMIKAYSFDS